MQKWLKTSVFVISALFLLITNKIFAFLSKIVYMGGAYFREWYLLSRVLIFEEIRYLKCPQIRAEAASGGKFWKLRLADHHNFRQKTFLIKEFGSLVYIGHFGVNYNTSDAWFSKTKKCLVIWIFHGEKRDAYRWKENFVFFSMICVTFSSVEY